MSSLQPLDQKDTAESAIQQYDVAVIGLGPVGATLSALLGKEGLSVVAIEPESEVYPLPRAAHFDHEIMRIFQALGIASEILPHTRIAPDYEFVTSKGETLIQFKRAGMMGASGWPVAFNFYQPGMELAIRASLEKIKSVELAIGSKFSRIVSNDKNGVIFEVVGNDTTARIAAKFLVGCDGAWSPVREDCGIQLDDYAFDEPWLVVDAKVENEENFPEKNLQLCDPERPTSFIHMGPGRLRWEFMLKPQEDLEIMKSQAAIDRLLQPWRRLGKIEVERSAVYRFHGLVAQSWRKNRVLLAGDAAHQMPPFLGQGLCSGLRDAANLAWKIVAAIKFGSGERLLDSYQLEREPHVRFVIEKAIEMGRVVCTLDAEKAKQRDKEMLATPQSGISIPLPGLADGCLLAGSTVAGKIFPQAVTPDCAVRLDDVLGSRAWLLHSTIKSKFRPENCASILFVDVDNDIPEPLRPICKEWMSDHNAKAVLVRPDRYIFGIGEAADLLDGFAQWQPEASRGIEPSTSVKGANDD